MSNSTLKQRSTLTVGAASLIGLASLFCSSPSQAAILNGGFETGDFSQWKPVVGSTTIQNSTYGSGPTQGTYDALLTTADSPVDTSTLENSLGLQTGSLNGVGFGNGDISYQAEPTGGNQGSGIEQAFTATAGQVLTFDWNFLTNEGTPSQFYNDFSFVNISSADNSISSLSKLADTSSTFTPSVTSNYKDTNQRFASETGFKTFSYTIPTTGTYSLGLGVTNVGDPYGSSGLLIDNVALSNPATTPVPEANSVFSVLAFSLLGLGSALKRKQQNKV